MDFPQGSNLTAFPIDENRILTRTKFIVDIGSEFIKTPERAAHGPIFGVEEARCVAEAYFLLSEKAFKPKRIEANHKTTMPKIAALTCAAISTVNPIRFAVESSDVTAVRYANPMFAMQLACSVIDHPYHVRAFEERRRLYEQILGLELPCLQPFLDDRMAKKNTPLSSFELNFTRAEMREIEGLVSIFTVYEEMKIYAKKQA